MDCDYKNASFRDNIDLAAFIKNQNVQGIKKFHQKRGIKCLEPYVNPGLTRCLEASYYAATHGYPKSLRTLIEIGYDVNAKHQEEPEFPAMTPLEYMQYTCFTGDIYFYPKPADLECVRILMQHSKEIPEYWTSFFTEFDKRLKCRNRPGTPGELFAGLRKEFSNKYVVKLLFIDDYVSSGSLGL